MSPDSKPIGGGTDEEPIRTEALWGKFEKWIDDPVASQHRLELVANRSRMMMREAIEAILHKEGLALVDRSDLIESASDIIRDGKNADMIHHQKLMSSENYSKSNSEFNEVIGEILNYETIHNSRIVREFSLSQFDQAKLIVGERLNEIHGIKTKTFAT